MTYFLNFFIVELVICNAWGQSKVISTCKITITVELRHKGKDSVDWVDDLRKYLMSKGLIPKGHPLGKISIGFTIDVLEHLVKEGKIQRGQITRESIYFDKVKRQDWDKIKRAVGGWAGINDFKIHKDEETYMELSPENTVKS